jgi:hypothetical protein
MAGPSRHLPDKLIEPIARHHDVGGGSGGGAESTGKKSNESCYVVDRRRK